MKFLFWWKELLGRLKRQLPSTKWHSGLPELTDDLGVLAGSTEGEFLSLGENLQGFYQRAEALSKACSEVASRMSGEDLQTVIEGFGALIEGINRLESGSKQNTDNLRSVLEKLEGLDDLADGFNKVILLLRVLCISIRIESARLGDRDLGFDTLASEVEKLSREIQDRSSKLNESCQSLSHMIGQTLERVLELEAARQKQAGIVLDKTMSGLESLLEKHGLSSKAAGQISAHFETVSKRIGEIVLSMQFHDITRQRIEHARDALVGIIPPEREEGGDLPLARNIAELQAAQLKYAGDELLSAVNQILDNLLALADLVEEMARETSGLAGAADKTDHSFLAEIETGFSLVMSAVGTYGEAGRELGATMGSVGGMLEEISAQAGSIESIGEKIKLISLNAIVKSCHIGNEGESLGVLAESTHQLSIETRRLTAIVGDALRSIIATSDSLITATDAGTNGGPGASTLAGEALGNQLETLRTVNQVIASMLSRVNLDGCSLSEDIRKAVGQVSVHTKIHQSLGVIVGKLEEMVAFLRQAPAEGPEGSDERMEALKASYTMQAEREVHEAIFRLDPQEKPALDEESPPEVPQLETLSEESGPMEASEDDLGDNVELF
ncbi:MAG: hypothetical protein ACP5SH_23925 [Syntrophobacteraceae bacterium]